MSKKTFFIYTGLLLILTSFAFFAATTKENPPKNHSVYEAMTALASTTDFTFKSKYYPGLGFFIEEINGVKNADGFYWTLYINGRYSTVGASQYILKDKDRYEWKYEKK